MSESLPDIGYGPLAPIPTGMAPEGGLEPPVRCLLCDIYGTLLISDSGDIGGLSGKSVPRTKLRDLLARHRIAAKVPDLLENLQAAVAFRHAAGREAGVAVPEVQIDAVWAEVLHLESPRAARPFALEFEMIMNPVWPMPGLSDLLAACRDKGIPLGIISNAQFFTLPLLERFLAADLDALGFHPQLRLLSFEEGCAKPDPTLFQKAVSRLERLGIPPAETAFIGNDMRNDIRPSRQAGFQTVLFAGDKRSLRLRTEDPQCSSVTPDLTVTHLKQLIEYLMIDS